MEEVSSSSVEISSMRIPEDEAPDNMVVVVARVSSVEAKEMVDVVEGPESV